MKDCKIALHVHDTDVVKSLTNLDEYSLQKCSANPEFFHLLKTEVVGDFPI